MLAWNPTLNCYSHEYVLLTWKHFFTNMSVKHNCLNYHKNKPSYRNKFIEIQIHWDLKLIQIMLKKLLLLICEQVKQNKSYQNSWKPLEIRMWTAWSLQVVFKNQYDILWIHNMNSGKWTDQVLLCQEDAWNNSVHSEAAKEFIS